MPSEYIIHSTTIANLKRILLDGYISARPASTTLLQLENHPYQIWSHADKKNRTTSTHKTIHDLCFYFDYLINRIFL